MVQTPFQIMSNWPVKFGNNTDDSPTIFLSNLLRFKRGYKINEEDTLENLDAVLIGEAQSWYQVNKRNWHNLEDFIQEFKQVYLNEKYLEVIHNKIRYCNQKKNQEIHSFIIEMRQLFEKLEPLPSLEWQLKKVYGNLRLEYKIYITRNSFKNFTELEILGREWEAEMAKSRMKGQEIKIWENNRNDRLYIREQERNQEQQNNQSHENNYERQNNSKYELYNIQSRQQFQPRYANNGTKYFYNNQRSQNTYPQNRGINKFQNRVGVNYNQNYRYPNPNNWFRKEENQIARYSNRQQLEGNPKLPELTYNLRDENQRKELEDMEQNTQETNDNNKGRYQENNKWELNPKAREFTQYREQKGENSSNTAQQLIKCYNCGGKGHMQRDCWYSQGNANGGY